PTSLRCCPPTHPHFLPIPAPPHTHPSPLSLHDALPIYPRRHALAGAGGRPPPRRDAASLGSGVRHYRPGGGHVLRSAREAEPRWALVGPGRAARHGLPLRVGPGGRPRSEERRVGKEW